MDWANIAEKFGLPGLMLVLFSWALVNVAKWWIASNERIQVDRIKVEDKKADATVAALISLSGEIRSHHTVEMQNHADLSGKIGRLEGSVAEAIAWQERTPVESPRPAGQRAASAGGYYPPRKPPRED